MYLIVLLLSGVLGGAPASPISAASMTPFFGTYALPIQYQGHIMAYRMLKIEKAGIRVQLSRYTNYIGDKTAKAHDVELLVMESFDKESKTGTFVSQQDGRRYYFFFGRDNDSVSIKEVSSNGKGISAPLTYQRRSYDNYSISSR